MTTIRELIEEGRRKLARVAELPAHEAEILLAAAIGRERSYLKAHPELEVRDCEATDRYEAMLTRRALGEPVAYLLGEQEFWSLPLRVGPGVLVPRPETELLVERALEHLPEAAGASILDLAAGSGAIALAIASERPDCRVVGTDVSPDAVSLARENAARTGLGNAEFRSGRWYEPVADERFDLICCNPPYIADSDPRVEASVRRFEPHEALFSGPTGLEALSEVVAGAASRLLPGGWLLVEHGDLQGPDVRALLTAAGFVSVVTHRDLAGLERCSEGQLPG